MGQPLVSVVIPTFNRDYCLARTIDSALAQTYSHLEILVVDDGSTDETADLVTTRYADEPRVVYLSQVNAGVSEARNTGIRHATGQYIAWLDSDDIWMPWKIQAQVSVLEQRPELGMCWTDMEAINPEGTVTHARYLRTMYTNYDRFADRDLFTHAYALRSFTTFPEDDKNSALVKTGEIFSQMIGGNLVHTSTSLVRTEIVRRVGYFDPELRPAGEDFDFHLRVCREAPVALIDLPSIQYQRGFTDHLACSDNRLPLALNFLKTISLYLERDRSRIRLTQQKLNEILAETHNWIGEMALQDGEHDLARKHLGEGLRYTPWNSRGRILWLLSSLPVKWERNLLNAYRHAKRRWQKPSPSHS